MIDIEDVKRLRLDADDVLVVQTAVPLSAQVRERLRTHLTAVMPALAGRMVIIDKSISLAVVDKAALA